jgi:hypothetical protein
MKLYPNTLPSLIRAARAYLQARFCARRVGGEPTHGSFARNRSTSFMTASCHGGTLLASCWTLSHCQLETGWLRKNGHLATHARQQNKRPTMF